MATGERHPAGRSATLLVRSGIEIRGTLEAIRADGDVLTGRLEDEDLLFLSRLLLVDTARRSIVIACSNSKPANHALLSGASIPLSGNHRGMRFEFVAGEPREAEFRGKPAIRLGFPAALLALQRREHPRFKVPPRVPLKCVAEWGPLSFDARVVDISRKGIGTILYDAGIVLTPGTRLRRARIEHPKRTVLVSLEVRHTKKIVLRDGRPAMRAGCRFIGARHDIDDLIRLFVTKLAG